MYTQGIAKFIADQNKYYTNYFFDAIKDPITGIVRGLANDESGEYINLMPNDSLGNFFYIRVDPNIRLIPDIVMTDCLPAIPRGFLGCTLVMCFNEGNPDTMVDNMVSSLIKAGGGNISMQGGILWDSVSVISNELSGLPTGENKEETIKRALARIDTFTFVSVSFSYLVTISLLDSDCYNNPCVC